jgi:hypothetical protein
MFRSWFRCSFSMPLLPGFADGSRGTAEFNLPRGVDASLDGKTLYVAVGPDRYCPTRHVIQRILRPCTLSYMTSYDVATNICEAVQA